jgi:NACHT domain
MKIERTELLSDLMSFALKESGIIVGRPGIGKTYLLTELHERMKSDGVPHLLLPIDQLGDGSEATLQAELSYQGDLIEKLQNEISRLDRKPGILLFDAFDAARNEQTQKRFLKLIRRAVRELKGLWNVVVTVRTFDAKKSQELISIFGSSFDFEFARYRDSSIPCRHLVIPPLTKDEIDQAVSQIPCLEAIRSAGSQDFKRLLEVPFNLWLLEKVLRESTDTPDLSQIRSTVQLLGLFWKYRVEFKSNKEDREIILTRAVRKMANSHSLSARKEELYRPEIREAWQELLSDEVLTEVSSTGQRVAFSHNILFDYAVSVLLIEDDPDALIAFISEDQSRPLFLRPSLTYYFTRLWYDEPAVFWNAFWYVLPNPNLHIRLFARLLLPSVLVNEARRVEELEPLVYALAQGKPEACEAVLRVLQALYVPRVVRYDLWVQVLDKLSEHIRKEFPWDLATHTSNITNWAINITNIEVLQTCGRISRRLLKWVWKERCDNKQPWIDGVGAHRGVPLVAKTFGTAPEESRQLLEEVLGITKEEKFPIEYLHRLIDEIENIWPFDPAFVVRIYFTVFGREETSEEKTYFGTPVMPLIGTRRQDYDMCQYLLIDRFPKFLYANSFAATVAVVGSLNTFILRSHVMPHVKGEINFESLVEEFTFRGKTAQYIQDNSYIWDAGYHEQPIKMADALDSFIFELSSSEEGLPKLDSILDIFRDGVWVAFFWRRLLETAARAPKIFAPRLFELCLARPVQLGAETVRELGAFVEAASADFTSEQLHQIEQSFLTIPEGENDEEHRGALERRRDRLLARIPAELLKTEEGRNARQAMVEADRVPLNEPLASFTLKSGTYTEEDWLRDRGVDLARPGNQELQSYLAPIGTFTSEWENKTPPADAIRAILLAAQEAYAALNRITDVDEDVFDSAFTRIAACANAMSRGITEPDSPEFRFCSEVLLAGAEHELPLPDPERDADYSSPGWSPTPRTEAAQGLPWLAARRPDENLLNAIEALTNDPVPSVRFLVTGELFLLRDKAADEFWRLVERIAEREKNTVVLQFLCHSLRYVAAKDEEGTTRVLDKIAARALSVDKDSELLNQFIPLLMWYALERNNSWATGIADSLLDDPVRWAHQIRRAAYDALSLLTPERVAASETKETTDRAVLWLMKAIDAASTGIGVVRESAKTGWTEELQTKLKDVYGVIDQIVLRLFFAADVRADLRDHGQEPVSDERRRKYYFKIKPLLEQILEFTRNKENGVLFASTAHHFMELLNGVLKYDPTGALHMAAGVAESSEPTNYNLDSMAIREVVKMVEAILADHRTEVQAPESLEDLLLLLDIFAKTGWSEALQLVWRLDEIFR